MNNIPISHFAYEASLGFCSLIDRETLLNEIMTSIEDLVSDQSQHVRAALGTQISGLAPILGKDE
jgi:serine/threonine-protein phosphatase 2A regulatory subunit A